MSILEEARSVFGQALEEASTLPWGVVLAQVSCYHAGAAAPRDRCMTEVSDRPLSLGELAERGHGPGCRLLVKGRLDQHFLVRPIAQALARACAEQSYALYVRAVTRDLDVPEGVDAAFVTESWKERAIELAVRAEELQGEYAVAEEEIPEGGIAWFRWSLFLSDERNWGALPSLLNEGMIAARNPKGNLGVGSFGGAPLQICKIWPPQPTIPFNGPVPESPASKLLGEMFNDLARAPSVPGGGYRFPARPAYPTRPAVFECGGDGGNGD